MNASKILITIWGILWLAAPANGQPIVPPGYYIEPYVTGLSTPNAIAFSPGGDFGYEGQLFVGDSWGGGGKIYRVPSKDNKIYFTTASDQEPRSFEFAPVGSDFAPGLYVTQAYSVDRYDSAGNHYRFAGVNAFPWDLVFAPDERFRGSLFHTDGYYVDRIVEWRPDASGIAFVDGIAYDLNAMAFGPGGPWGTDLYFTSTTETAIKTVTPDGHVSDFLVSSQFPVATQMAFDTTGNFGGNLFLSDVQNEAIYEIDPAGNVSTFASGFDFWDASHHKQDGGDLVFGPDGALYVCDAGAGTIYRIIPEPAALSLLALGGLALIRRRKKHAFS